MDDLTKSMDKKRKKKDRLFSWETNQGGNKITVGGNFIAGDG